LSLHLALFAPTGDAQVNDGSDWSDIAVSHGTAGEAAVCQRDES